MRDYYGPRGPKMFEKNEKKVRNISPESRDYYGPRGPKMIEKSETHEPRIEGLIWAKGSKHDRKSENNEFQIEAMGQGV